MPQEKRLRYGDIVTWTDDWTVDGRPQERSAPVFVYFESLSVQPDNKGGRAAWTTWDPNREAGMFRVYLPQGNGWTVVVLVLKRPGDPPAAASFEVFPSPWLYTRQVGEEIIPDMFVRDDESMPPGGMTELRQRNDIGWASVWRPLAHEYLARILEAKGASTLRARGLDRNDVERLGMARGRTRRPWTKYDKASLAEELTSLREMGTPNPFDRLAEKHGVTVGRMRNIISDLRKPDEGYLDGDRITNKTEALLQELAGDEDA